MNKETTDDAETPPLKIEDCMFNIFIRDNYLFQVDIYEIHEVFDLIKKGLKVRESDAKNKWMAWVTYHDGGKEYTVDLGCFFTSHPKQLWTELLLGVNLRPIKWEDKIVNRPKKPIQKKRVPPRQN